MGVISAPNVLKPRTNYFVTPGDHFDLLWYLVVHVCGMLRKLAYIRHPHLCYERVPHATYLRFMRLARSTRGLYAPVWLYIRAGGMEASQRENFRFLRHHLLH